MSASLLVKRLASTAVLPSRTRALDAAYDLALPCDVTLAPGTRTLVGLGFAISLPPATAGLVLPRSGLASRNGITMSNVPGLIDESYTGEVMLSLWNTSDVEWTGQAGDRVAQLLIVGAVTPEDLEVDELPASADDRGAGGFGSSGI